ncbi:ATP-binding cassette domain-containing protein [Georgenia sp. Z1344]|uniref:ATP-binding cassette domain-containing protein n=1 Tax=Georgenia sp. Z1344 TaxID=3416706 RepID=UPI003CF27E99
MTGYRVEIDDLGVRLGRTQALDGVTTTIEPGSITGLLGRNGAGKSTLLGVVAALRRPTSGRVRVEGADPFEHETLMEGTCLVREAGDLFTTENVRANLRAVRQTRPRWDQAFADELLDAFEVDPKKSVDALSRGNRSAVAATIGLASRAPLTMFDEVYLGMDAPSRALFYERLLADYAEHPRTIVLSSHLISEIEQLLEHVIILDRGGLRVAGDADEITAGGLTVTGPADAVDRAVADLEVLAVRTLGGTKEAAVYGRPDRATLRGLEDQGLAVGRLGLQELVIHLTERTS